MKKDKNIFSQIISGITVAHVILAQVLLAGVFVISAPQALADDSEWKAPTVSIEGGEFTDPDNAFSSDDNYTSVDVNNDEQQYGNFNIPTIPVDSTIDGIEVLVEAKSNADSGNPRHFRVALSGNNGADFTSNKDTINYGTSDTVDTLGSSTNKWNRTTWTPDDFTNTNFKLRIKAELGADKTLFLDSIQVKVYYTPPDTTPPTVESIMRADANPTNASVVHFTVTFSESVTGVDKNDFSLTTTGSVSDASIKSVNGNNETRTVKVDTGTGDGTIRLDVSDGDTIIDADSNPLGGAGAGNGDFTAGEFYTIDKTKPTVTINQAAGQADPTNSSPINFEVVFSEPVTDFIDEDVTVSWTTGGTKTVVVSGSDEIYIYNVAVSGMNSGGTITVNIPKNKVTDLAGNKNTVSTSTDNQVTFYNYAITANAGAGGMIDPSGLILVDSGDDQDFIITPDAGYIVSDVLVDGESVGRVNAYTFTDVVADHTISAIFDGGWSAPSNFANNHNVSHPARAYSSDDSYAVFNKNDWVDYFDFGLNIPSDALINGIEVAVEGNRNEERTLDVSLSWDGGESWTSDDTGVKNFGSTYTSSDSTVVLGGSEDMWGRSWLASESDDFGIRVAADSSTTNQLSLDQIQVKVYYTVPDTTPPTASITSPSDGDEVSGISEITADASDDQSGIQKVEFWYSDAEETESQIGTDTETPYSTNWDTTSVIDGPYNLWAKAYNNATSCMSSESEEVSVTINNIEEIYGCTNPEAINYEEEATEDDGSCEYEGEHYCGDGIINQENEQCDGEDGVGENQSCSQDCTLIYNILGGQFTASGGSGDSTPSVTAIGDTTIDVSTGDGTSTILIPNGTVISRTDGESLDINGLTANSVSADTLSDLGTGVVIDGALQWGVVDHGLEFSSPITLSIYVGTSLNGQTLNILRSINGTSDWTNDGIVSPATCLVSSGLCAFQATKASYYAATHIASTGGEESSGGGGNPSSPELTISNETIELVAETSATITWTTSYKSTSQVIYATEGEVHTLDLNDYRGTPPKYGYVRTTLEYDEVPKVKNHSVTITDLNPGTTYYYRTVSHGSLAVGEEHAFTTPGEQQQNVPLIEISGNEITEGNTGMGEETTEEINEATTEETTPMSEVAFKPSEEVKPVIAEEKIIVYEFTSEQKKLLSDKLDILSALLITYKEIAQSKFFSGVVIILVILFCSSIVRGVHLRLKWRRKKLSKI